MIEITYLVSENLIMNKKLLIDIQATNDRDVLLSCNFLATIYSTLISKQLNKKGLTKIQIFLQHSNEYTGSNSIFSEKNRASIGAHFETDRYMLLKLEEKKEYVNELIFKSLSTLIEEGFFDFNINTLREIKEDIKVKQYTYQFVLFKKAFYSKSRKVFAQIKVNPQIDKYDYIVSFYDNKTKEEICSITIFSGQQSFFYLKEIFNRHYFDENENFIIYSNYNEYYFECSFNKCKVEIKYHTQYKNEEAIQKSLYRWSYDATLEQRFKN